MANLKAHGTAMSIYAAEWSGKLPSEDPAVGGGLLLWDVTVSMTDNQLAKTGMDGKSLMVRKVYYCPLNLTQNQPQFWDYTGGVYRVVGYYFLNNRKNTTLAGLTLPKYPKITTIARGMLQDQELVIDVVMSKQSSPAVFTNLMLGGGGPFNTSHMRGSKPDGSNITFIDGHVEFRAFSDMQNRFNVPKGAPDDIIEWF